MVLTVSIIAPATDPDIEITRALSLQCMEQIFGEGSQGGSVMLPIALSPTGTAPATHYLCHAEMTQETMDAINEFAVENFVAVTVSEGETLPEFLERVELQVVS